MNLLSFEEPNLFDTDAHGHVAIEARPARQLHFEMWKPNRVDAVSLEDFLSRFYKHDRYMGRGEDYAAAILKSNRETIEAHGCTWISHYESVTGEVVSYYP